MIKSDFLNKAMYSNLEKGVAKLVKYLRRIFSCKENVKIFATNSPQKSKGFVLKLWLQQIYACWMREAPVLKDGYSNEIWSQGRGRGFGWGVKSHSKWDVPVLWWISKSVDESFLWQLHKCVCNQDHEQLLRFSCCKTITLHHLVIIIIFRL